MTSTDTLRQTATVADLITGTLPELAEALGPGTYPAVVTVHNLPGAVWSGELVVVGPANFVHFVPAARV